MGDLNKAPNDFFDNWNKIQSMSYKNVIEQLVKRSSEKKILALIQFELDQFSENVQKDLTISETSTFYQELSNLFRDSNWWSTATVTDACKYYLNCARNNISYFENYADADSDLSQIEKNEIFALYQLCTLFVSWNALREKKIREVIDSYYDGELFIKTKNKKPTKLSDVQGTNNVLINIFEDYEKKKILIISSIDNLIKGASGQAIQNMNLMFGFKENESLI